MTCALCVAHSCVLDFALPCCTARYIASLKTLEQRRGWLDRIAARRDAEFIARVQAQLKILWARKKQGQDNENHDT